MLSIEDKIEQIIDKADKGHVFFTEDFREQGSPEAVKTALYRLGKRAFIERIGKGIYAKAAYSKLLCKEVLPSLDKVAKSIAQRDKVRLIPTGSYALYSLGLSTQIPLKVVYLTDGSPRKINLTIGEIQFKRTSPRNLNYKGKISTLVVQALKEIGQDKVTDKEIKQLLEHLKKEEYHDLKHDIKNAPQWIAEIMAKVL